MISNILSSLIVQLLWNVTDGSWSGSANVSIKLVCALGGEGSWGDWQDSPTCPSSCGPGKEENILQKQAKRIQKENKGRSNEAK